MDVLSYKCPNCSGPLKFSAEKQLFACEFCKSELTKQQLDTAFPGQNGAKQTVASSAKKTAPDLDADVMEYSCPSCGAAIITSATTAAATCYYCHNPVVISGRLSDNFRPDKIIPFVISKEQAIESFKTFCGKKKFLPKDFYSSSQIDNIRGVYYPYYLFEALTNGSLTAEGRNTRTWRSGDTEYTEISVYDVWRKGEISIDGISLSAINSNERDMLKYVCPYDDKKAIDFSSSYLSGFEAEKRDLEKNSLQNEVNGIVSKTTERLLRNSISGYGSVHVKQSGYNIIKDKWDYALFPVWVMTYKFKGKTYIYAMNGQTGKFYGMLPVNKSKLLLVSGLSFAASFAGILLALFAGGLL